MSTVTEKAQSPVVMMRLRQRIYDSRECELQKTDEMLSKLVAEASYSLIQKLRRTSDEVVLEHERCLQWKYKGVFILASPVAQICFPFMLV